MTWPSRWAAGIMPIQLFRLGNFYIIGVPGEFTTMSGRRLRVRRTWDRQTVFSSLSNDLPQASVLNALKQNGAADNNTVVVIAGLSNQYSHYIATAEEYGKSQYKSQAKKLHFIDFLSQPPNVTKVPRHFTALGLLPVSPRSSSIVLIDY